MSRPKNIPDVEWRKKCNARHAARRLHVAALNCKRRKEKPVAFLYAEAKKRAKKAGLPFNIEPSDIVVPLFCPLLGLVLTSNAGNKKFSPSSPSLDRINNDLGYIKGNVRVISDLANRMKRNATPEQLRIFAISILVEQGFLELEY